MTTVAVDAAMLRDAVAWTARGLPARPTSPILTGVLVTADADRLAEAVSARATLPAQVTGAAQAVLP